MDVTPLGFVAGLLLGLASSLHCAAMCGGVCAGVMVMLDRDGQASRARLLVLSQLGRGISYVVLGGLIGGVGASFVGILPATVGLGVLRWANAVALVWIGLNTASLLPSFAMADRLMMAVSSRIGRLAPASGGGHLAPFGIGLAWGAMPCAMLYGALLTAMLAGSMLAGASVMAGFALGTMPAVAATGLGVHLLADIDSRASVKVGLGLLIAGLGFATAYIPSDILALLCR